MATDAGRSSKLLDDQPALRLTAGAEAAGAFRCAGCGYGVTVTARLPACPMCAGTTWQRRLVAPDARTPE